MKLDKRMLALLLVLATVFSLQMPVTVNAAEETVYNIGKDYDGKSDEVMTQSAADYASGKSNWKLERYVGGSATFFKNNVSKIYGSVGDYYVYRIKSPGSGVHSLTLNYATFFRSGMADIYILDTATTDIAAALIPENRVGKVDFYNENTNTTTDIAYGSSSVVGRWNFGSASEYFVVLQCSEAAPIYTSYCYIYPTSLKITKGSLTPTPLPQRARSLTVETHAVTTFEVATYCATGTINGRAMLFIPTEGKRLFVYDMVTKEKFDEVATMFTVCRGITADPDGKIWMVGSQNGMQCYDPNTGAVTTYNDIKSVVPNYSSGFDLIYADNGCLYFGGYSNAAVVEFNPATKKFRSLGSHNADASYACAVAYDPDGYIYAGLVGNKNSDSTHTREVVKIRISDGVCVGRTDVSDCVDKKEIMIRGGALCGDVYIAGGIEMNKMLAIDTNTMTQKTLYCSGKAITNPISFSVSESYGGKHYFSLNGKAYNGSAVSHRAGFYAIDDTTGEVKPVSANFTSSMRLGQDSIIDINGDPCAVGYSGSGFRYLNLKTDKIVVLNNLVGNADGAPISLHPMARGEKGSKKIYVGAFNTEKCAIIDTETGTVSGHFYTNGQTDCMTWYNGNLYAGNYKGGIVVQVDMQEKENNKVLLDFRYSKDPNGNTFDQVRVHAITAGDNKIFAGTMPDSYKRGGCIGWYDLKTGESYIERNVVRNQSINSLAYHNGYLYGTTTTAGGTGASDDTSLSAKLFVYDVANKRKVAEIDLRQHIAGLPSRLTHLAGITPDPQIAVNGKFWGVVAETLYSFTFDKTTNTIHIKEELVISKDKYTGGSSNLRIEFLEGYLYTYFRGSSVFCKIKMSDPSQYTVLPVSSPGDFMISEDKNLYYYNDSTIYVYPLVMTSADKTAAEKIDKTIAALPRPVTLQNKSAIESARATYNAMPYAQKALVQNYYLLEEAEAELLEARIAALNMNLLDRTLVNELLAAYFSMTIQQRRCVSNYNLLAQAQKKLDSAVYSIGKTNYSTLQAALNAAKSGDVIKLLQEDGAGSVVLPDGVTLDLNGFRLTCSDLNASAGKIIDSADAAGLLVCPTAQFAQNNPQLPLWDRQNSAYRLFAYTMTMHTELIRAGEDTYRFWFALELSDRSAYRVVQSGYAGLRIGVELSWNGTTLKSSAFTAPSADNFCKQWARAMLNDADTALYADITGIDTCPCEGTLTVRPWAQVNGVTATVTGMDLAIPVT